MKAYIINFTFEDLVPQVWRKVIMPAGATFHRMHETIQYVTNFQSRMEQYYPIEIEVEDFIITNDENRINKYKGKSYKGKKLRQPTSLKIDQYLENEREFIYQYDQWTIKVSLEEVVEDYYFGYPTLLGGEGDAPPEHLNGAEEYKEFLKMYENPKHPDYLSASRWAEKHDYKPFDDYEINEQLKYVKYKKTEWGKIKHKNYFVIEDKYRVDQVNIIDLPDKELIIDYIRACTNLYGTISFSAFLKIYNEQNSSQLTGKELRAFVRDVAYQLNAQFISISNNRFVHEALTLYKEDMDFLLTAVKGKPFYIPEKEELLQYKEDDYYEMTNHLELLGKRLAKDFFGGSMIMVKDELDELVGEIQMIQASYTEIVKQFIERFDFQDMKEVNEYIELLTNVFNTTRRWENQGHTPVELSSRNRDVENTTPQLTVINGGKIGRNDVCPCGSGKKYKKCCGKS